MIDRHATETWRDDYASALPDEKRRHCRCGLAMVVQRNSAFRFEWRCVDDDCDGAAPVDQAKFGAWLRGTIPPSKPNERLRP